MNSDLSKTKSAENQRVIELSNEIGIERLGLMSSQAFYDDPRSLLFSLARYKFVAKTLRGRKKVLEIGCGDAFHSRLVQQEVASLTVTDHDPLFISDIEKRCPNRWKPLSFVHDMLLGPTPQTYDSIYLLDVLEHIEIDKENTFLANILLSIDDGGTLIIGMPSIQSQQYASEISRMGHVNCKTGDDLRRLLEPVSRQVMVFSMNDEIVHTGYFPLSHYLIAVACVQKNKVND